MSRSFFIFCISFGNRTPRVWRKPYEADKPGCMKSSIKFPQSIMVWDIMLAAGVGPLCFLRTNVTAAVYQEVLEHFVLPTAEQLFRGDDLTFQHDLAPAHKAKSITIKVLPRMEYKSCLDLKTPDLSSMENLWRIAKKRMAVCRPTTLEQLKVSIRQAWSSVTPANCQIWYSKTSSGRDSCK